MKRICLISLLVLLGLNSFGQSRRVSTTRSNASQRQSVELLPVKPNYDPVILKLGEVLEVDDGVAYVKITTKYTKNDEGYYYFYACNLKAEATAMFQFRTEQFADVCAMDIIEGTCEKGDYVYMRFVPKAPLDVLLPF